MYKRQTKTCGYTLVEVLIGLMLFGFLFAGSYTAYRDFIGRAAIDRSVQDLKTAVASTKQYALSGEKPNGWCAAPKKLIGFMLNFSGAPNSYSSYLVCEDGWNSFLVNSFAPNAGVTYTVASGSPTSVTFKTLGQGTDLTSNIQITFTHSTYGNQRTVTISPAGVVQ